MIKNIGIAILFIALILSFSSKNCEKVTVEPYKQNQMVGGCVMQKSGDQWIRTCG